MRTLLLDAVEWDLLIDAAGNIAFADKAYALAQDAASAIKLFKGEAYYNTTKGVPYWDNILGEPPSIAYMKDQFNVAALSVPEVLTATSYITSFVDRQIKGQVQITSAESPTPIAVNF